MSTRLSQYRRVEPALVEQRAAPRRPILLSPAVTVSKRKGAPVEATLRDLSVYGCRLACRASQGEGQAVLLQLGVSEPVSATVIWNDGEHIGCRFDAPIARALVRELTLVIC